MRDEREKRKECSRDGMKGIPVIYKGEILCSSLFFLTVWSFILYYFIHTLYYPQRRRSWIVGLDIIILVFMQ